MRQEVVARVVMEIEDPTKLLVVVRKTIIKDNETVDKKFGLSLNGDWVEVPEATVYPPECFLPVSYQRVAVEIFDKLATLAVKPVK